MGVYTSNSRSRTCLATRPAYSRLLTSNTLIPPVLLGPRALSCFCPAFSAATPTPRILPHSLFYPHHLAAWVTSSAFLHVLSLKQKHNQPRKVLGDTRRTHDDNNVHRYKAIWHTMPVLIRPTASSNLDEGQRERRIMMYGAQKNSYWSRI